MLVSEERTPQYIPDEPSSSDQWCLDEEEGEREREIVRREVLLVTNEVHD